MIIVVMPKSKQHSAEYYSSGTNAPIPQNHSNLMLDPSKPIMCAPKRKFSTEEVGIYFRKQGG